MSRWLTLFLLLLAGAGAWAQGLQHHEIRPDQLPPPFASPSAENAPRVVSRPADATLTLPPGFAISVYASGLSNPRMMALAENGDVFVAESQVGKITILRDGNRDGVAEDRFTFAGNLPFPFGLAFRAGFLYVGQVDAVARFPYSVGQTSSGGRPPELVASLPSGGHLSRNIAFSPDGSKLYVAVGSSSNANPESDPARAAITEMNPDGSERRIYASGLRNPSGMAFEPVSGALWTAVNERDSMGDDLVPDFVTRVQPGGFYGWPYAYIGQHPQPGVSGRPDLVASSLVPSVLLQAHSASLGLVFYNGALFPPDYAGDAFVALHGSWNRSRRTGYKVIRIPMQNGQPRGGYDDFIVGWSPDETSTAVWGRPVGILVLSDGSLLVSDDGANVVWRVTYSRPERRRAVRH